MSLATAILDGEVALVVGTGGVGKTTTAAAMAVAAARAGRRAVVVTIDPARRLADALGAAEIGNEPHRIAGPWTGELWALMLDPKATFDELITRYAEDDDQIERILGNRIYQNLSGVLSGTQEYMASEKLFELHESGDFDLIVVDTPPTRNALDFLQAPDQIVRFLDGRVVRLLFPTAMRRVVTTTLQLFLRRVASVVGSEIVDDVVAFLQAFAGMEEGFSSRAKRVQALLGSDETAFVLVAAPRRDATQEALFFARYLVDADLRVGSLVVNRAHPVFGDQPSAVLTARAAELSATPLGPAYAALAEAARIADAEQVILTELVGAVDPAPVTTVPLLDHDVHDLAAIEEIADWLVASE